MVWPEAGAREKPGGWRLSGNEWMGGGILSAASLRAEPRLLQTEQGWEGWSSGKEQCKGENLLLRLVEGKMGRIGMQ